MTLRRLGRTDEAARLLEPIHAGLDVKQDRSYLNRLLMYKGVYAPEDLLRAGGDPLTRDTYGYAVGNWLPLQRAEGRGARGVRARGREPASGPPSATSRPRPTSRG